MFCNSETNWAFYEVINKHSWRTVPLEWIRERIEADLVRRNMLQHTDINWREIEKELDFIRNYRREAV